MNYEEYIDVSSAKERFMGNYGLFTRFLFDFPRRSLYGNLEQALADGDATKAFEVAHTMKGIVGNLSLKLIAAPLNDVVEVLRKGSLPDETAKAKLHEAYINTLAAIDELKASGNKLF